MATLIQREVDCCFSITALPTIDSLISSLLSEDKSPLTVTIPLVVVGTRTSGLPISAEAEIALRIIEIKRGEHGEDKWHFVGVNLKSRKKFLGSLNPNKNTGSLMSEYYDWPHP